MRYNSRTFLAALSILLIVAMISIPVYGEEPPWSISYQPPESLFPVLAVVDVKEGVLIGPFIISTSMAGTVTLISPAGEAQTLSVRMGDGGFSGDVSLTELGTYQIEENYTLTVELSLSSFPLKSESFPKTHEWKYNNRSSGIKTFNVTSSLSNFSADIQGHVEIYSVKPSSVEPGGESVSFMLRSLEGVEKGAILASSVTLSSLWDKVASITIDNLPPSLSVTSALQSFSNNDVKISFKLQDAEDALCIMETEYKLSSATSWSPATISESYMNPGPGVLYWKAPLDQPNGRGIYNIRMRASDKFSYSSWASRSFRLNNTAAVDNNPPSALNPHIRTIDGATNQEVDREPIAGDRLKAEYTFYDLDAGDTERNSQLKWYKFGVLQESVTVSGEQSKILSEPLHKGERWYFTIIPSDGKITGDIRQSATITVANAPPYVQAVRILPISPTAKDDLQADYDYFDPDNDPEGSSEIRWYRNGILQSFYSNLTTLPASATLRGEKWSFSVKPRDIDGASGVSTDSPVITVINQKPVVEILSVLVSEASGDVTVTYSLSDEDEDLCKLSIWYQGGPVGLAKTAAHVAEATEENHIITRVSPGSGLMFTWQSKKDQPSGKADDFRIGIKPNDGMDNGNEVVSQHFSLDNNTEPTVSNVAISPPAPFSSDDLIATYNFDDPDGDEESASEIKWYKGNIHQTEYNNLNILPHTATKRDESWYFTVRPGDGKELGPLKPSAAVNVKNAPPVALEVRLEPEDATSDDNLKAVYTYNDADGDPETSTQIRWYRNDLLQAGYNDQDLIPSTDTVKGQVWYFTVRPSDGITAGELVKSNQVALGNMVPLVQGLSIPPEGFRDVAIKFDLVDSDGDKCTLNVEYRGGMASDWTQATIREPVTGVTPGLVTLTWESARDEDVQKPTKFQIRVTPNDGSATGDTVESGFFTLDNNIPPVASNLRITPPDPRTADNLVASYDYSDEDGGPESGSEVVWSRNGIQTSSKGKTLLASATSKGDVWTFTVRPRDGAKYGSPYVSQPVTILNTPPMARNVTVAPAAPESGDFLTLRYDYHDVDEDRELGSEIEWYKNGALEMKNTVISDDDKRLPVPVSKDERWYAVLRPKDGTDFGAPVTSPSVGVDNAAPIIQDVTVSGNSGDVLITYSLIDGDGDLCDLEVHYQGGSVKTAWTVTTIKEPTTRVLPGIGLRLTWVSKVDEGGWKASDYKIRITPHDSLSIGINGISSTFTLNNNSAPTAVELSMLPEMPGTADDLQVDYTFMDPDGDKEGKPEIHWYKNSIMETLYNDLLVLPASSTSKGDRWYYTIKVNDGKEYSKTQLSPHVTIGNAPPEVTSFVLTPEQPMAGDQLVSHYTYSDVDGDSEDGTQIKWYRNGVHRTEYDNFTILPSVAVLAGDEWYFTVMPRDGFDFGIPRASNKVFVSNLPPFVSSLSILPAVPLTTDELRASYVYIDPENDPEEGTKIVWYKNSIAQTAYNDMISLSASATIKNQVWHFEAQPRDGKQYGSVQKSNFVVIKNTPPRVGNLSISPPYPLSNDDLLVDYDYSDADGDVELRSDIWWHRNDIRMRAYDGLKKLPSKETFDGQIWHFTVKPNDGADLGEMMVSQSVEIGSPIPRVNNLFIIPRTPLTTDALEANYIYTDPKNIPESGSQITWYKNNVAQTEHSNVRVLPAVATSRDEQWHFSVKPSNGRQFGEEQSSAPVTIINSPPALAEVMPLPSRPTTDEDLVVDYIFSDPDGDAEAGNEIKWFRDGVLQSAYNGITEVPASATKRDEEWYFTIKSVDGTSFSDLATSSIVTIGNGIPGIINIDLTPADPLTDSDLKVSYTYIDTEEDPELGTEIRWYRNDGHEPGYNDMDSVPSVATARDEQWYCTVMPSDGTDFGAPVSSPVVTIANTSPTAVEILALSEQILRGDSILIVSYGQDTDAVDTGPALKCQTEFRVGASPWVEIPTEYAETPIPRWEAVFAPDARATLGEYDLRARFTDDAGATSDWIAREKMVTVMNNQPEIGAGVDDLLVPEDTVKEFDLRLYGDDLEDGKTLTWVLDADSVDKELFQASISGNRFLEIRPVGDKNGQDDITLKLTDTDGDEIVKADVTIIIDAVNDPPTVPTIIRIDPANPRTLDNLICAAEGSSDVDGDTVVYRFQWYKDGEQQSNLAKSTVPYSRTLKGELWRCEVIPSDGISDGPSRVAEVTVANSLPEVSIRKIAGNIRDILITFDLKDADSDDCDLKLEYRIKGKSWKSATVKESLRGVKPGTGLTLTWLSHVDEANVVTDECRMRVTPNDGVGAAAPGESESFFLDNKPPEFTVTAIANPIHGLYIDVTVVSDEDLDAPPDISAVLEEEQTVTLDVQSISDIIWTGKLALEPGFDGDVLFVIEGIDVVGNTGKMELQKEFQTPSPLPRPDVFAFKQNYPNPVGEDTSIPYQLPESSLVTIQIYSMTGQLVRTLDLGYKVAGFYLSKDRAAYWDGNDDNGSMVASGVYFYYLKAGHFEGVKKMAVQR